MVFWPKRSQDTRAQPIVIGDVILISDSDSLHALDKEMGAHIGNFNLNLMLF